MKNQNYISKVFAVDHSTGEATGAMLDLSMIEGEVLTAEPFQSGLYCVQTSTGVVYMVNGKKFPEFQHGKEEAWNLAEAAAIAAGIIVV